MRRVIISLIVLGALLLPGCSGIVPITVPSIPGDRPAVETQEVLNLGIMVHLEGWNDGVDEASFERHAALLRDYATLFEQYGAKLTLESKEMTEGAIRWHDNVLLEMENRGHAIGVHADVGGSRKDSTGKMEADLARMKSQLESLGVTVRHVSGVNSHCDWVTATADAGFEFVTGVVSYALLSLPPRERPITIPDNARPGEFHEAYPFNMEGRLHPWRAENGSNWISDTPNGRIVIIPSGGGLAYSYEEAQDKAEQSGTQDFTIESDKSTQPYTYYVAWSFGKALDIGLVEQWLQVVNKYVVSGKVQWRTIPEMYDDYLQWETDSGRR